MAVNPDDGQSDFKQAPNTLPAKSAQNKAAINDTITLSPEAFQLARHRKDVAEEAKGSSAEKLPGKVGEKHPGFRFVTSG